MEKSFGLSFGWLCVFLSMPLPLFPRFFVWIRYDRVLAAYSNEHLCKYLDWFVFVSRVWNVRGLCAVKWGWFVSVVFFLMVMFILLLVSQFVVRLVCILWISIRFSSGKGKTVRICSFVIVLWKNVYLFSIFLYWLCVFDVIYFSECNVF